jgi:hypothetical protein
VQPSASSAVLAKGDRGQMIRILLALVALTLGGAARSAEPLPEARREIGHLLDYLGQSGCQFNRNATWYGAAEARSHLENKLAYLSKKGLVRTAEDFIHRAASRSSMSGTPYLVRCGSGVAVPCEQWLQAELERHRRAREGQRP